MGEAFLRAETRVPAESFEVPQAAIDILYIYSVSTSTGLKTPLTEQEATQADHDLIKAVCQKRGLTVDRIQDDAYHFIVYTAPPNERNYEHAIDVELEVVDVDMAMGELTYNVCYRKPHGSVEEARYQKVQVTLQASMAARQRVKSLEVTAQLERDEEERRRMEFRATHFPPAMKFVRTHLGEELSVSELGNFGEFLKGYMGWELEPEDRLYFGETPTQWEVHWMKDGDTYDIAAFSQEEV